MAAPSKQGATGTSLISRTLERCKFGLKLHWLGAAGADAVRERPVAGCFPVYVGAERVRFVVRAEYASHPLFRRLLDDAQREYGHAACGITLPCDVDAYLDVLWHMEHGGDGGGDEGDGDGDGEINVALLSPPPIWGLRGFRKGRAAGNRMMNPRSSAVVDRIREHKEIKLARTRSPYS